MTAAVMGVVGSATFAYGLNNKQHAKRKQCVKAINYPASANFPDLRKHNNVMAKHLTPDVSLIFNLFTPLSMKLNTMLENYWWILTSSADSLILVQAWDTTRPE